MHRLGRDRASPTSEDGVTARPARYGDDEGAEGEIMAGGIAAGAVWGDPRTHDVAE